MRPSPQRHPLAVLRTLIGFTQKEMAQILECSTATVQAVELGKLRLSERLAQQTVLVTGVSLDWLLAGDVEKPPLHRDERPYVRADFDNAQAVLQRPFDDVTDPDFASDFIGRCAGTIASAMLAAIQSNRYGLFRYKTRQALDALARQFGNWPALEQDLNTCIDYAVSENPPNFEFLFYRIHKEMMKLFKAKSREASSGRDRAGKSSRIRAGTKTTKPSPPAASAP